MSGVRDVKTFLAVGILGDNGAGGIDDGNASENRADGLDESPEPNVMSVAMEAKVRIGVSADVSAESINGDEKGPDQ